MNINRKVDHKDLWINSMTGMSMGFFSTLILGTLVGLIGLYSKDNIFLNVKNVLMYISPFAVGIGIGMKSKLNPLQILALALGSFIVSKSLIVPIYANDSVVFDKVSINLSTNIRYVGDILSAWLSGVIFLYLISIFKLKTNWDFIILPVTGILIGISEAFWLTYVITMISVGLEYTLNKASQVNVSLMIILAPLIGAVLGLSLSLPISSAAIAFTINMHGDAAIAGLAGTSAQMITFGVLTFWSTKSVSKTLAVGFGTSMLQLDNFMRRPKLLIIPTLSSAITALVAVATFKGTLSYNSDFATAGMGTSVLYGQIMTMQIHGWSNLNGWMFVIFIQLLLPILIGFISIQLIEKTKFIKIKKEWLNIWTNTQPNTLEKPVK